MTRPDPRRILAGALAFVLGAMAVAPHRHAGDSFELFRPDLAAGTVVHEIVCAEPTALHWHADHLVEVEPCLACLRNHTAGIPSIAIAQLVSTGGSALAAVRSVRLLLSVRNANSSRGPPGLPA